MSASHKAVPVSPRLRVPLARYFVPCGGNVWAPAECRMAELKEDILLRF